MKKRYYSVLLTALLSTSGYSQSIINGDFEINSASSCQYNLSDFDYNNFMSYSWGFGNNIYSGNDIQTTGCGYATPINNLFFIGLSKNGTGNGINGISDAISLKIDTPLTTGLTYQLSYYEFSSNDFGNPPVSLEIGLSLDSLTFGQQIYTSIPSINSWMLKSFSFIAPSNGKYLTVRNVLNGDTTAGEILGWNFIDNFQITLFTQVEENNPNISFNIYPNPFANELNVMSSSNELLEIIIYDISTRKILQQEFTNSVSLNTEQLAKGLYLYEVRDKNSVIKKGKIVKD